MKSFTERNPTIIGIIVVALIASGTGAALLLNGGFFKDRYTVHGIFTDTAGLKKGDKVRVAGVLAGEVKGPVIMEHGGGNGQYAGQGLLKLHGSLSNAGAPGNSWC